MVSVSQFINELHRRNVFRSGAAYVVTAWLLIQVADVLLETYAAPAWAMRTVVTTLAIGFPVALILAWIYEFTTQGVKRTGQSSEDELIAAHAGRKIDFAIIGVLLVAVALFAADRFRWIDFGTIPSTYLRSIAVLPLANLSGDPAQEYFSDGMTETLITELSKIAALRVISRQSVMQFKGTKLSLPEIASKLNVDAVIEGSALLIGDQVRITVQLIDAATDVHLWADDYDRDLSDVLAIHSEVARAIAQEIQIAVTPEEAARLADVREVNPEAHRLYLLGQYHLYKWEPADLEKAVRYFQQAIEVDPDYAQPHVGLAIYYGALGFFGYMPPRIAFEKQRAEAALALEIDGSLASAHAEHALVYFYLDWDWQKAEEKFQRVFSLDSNYAYAHQFYAWFLAAMDRTTEAHTSVRRALELDPLSVLAYMTASDVFWLSRQYDQAITQLHETLDLFPNEPQALSRLGRNYEQKGMLTEAIGEAERAVTLSPEFIEHYWMLGHAYAVAGRTACSAWALALEIDGSLASAHAEHALVYFYLDWDWQKAEEKFQRVFSLDSNYAYAHQFYAWFLAAMDRTTEAHTSVRRALELDPLSVLAYMTASDVFWLSRQYDQAITQLHETLDLFPNEPQALSRLGRNYEQKGMLTEAIGEAERAVTLSPEFIEHYWMLGHAYAVAGRTAEARKVLDDLHALAEKRYVLPYGFAVIHTGLGENDEALEWLEKAYQDRNGWMVYLQLVPWLDPLRSDPRFQDLMRRMNYPE